MAGEPGRHDADCAPHRPRSAPKAAPRTACGLSIVLFFDR
ncbi:hypothetical protein C7S14_8514 [Burkholderia cepacia]|nr:hypothetical protein C7S14_8514 [Burkholderia cepacia]